MENYFFEMIPAEEMAQLNYIPTVSEFLNWIEKKWSSRPAVSTMEKSYSYQEFCERIGRRRALLNTLGLSQGDRIAIMERTSIDAVEMFLAASSAGFVPIMLPASLPVQAVHGCCLRFGAALLVLRPEFSAMREGAPCQVVESTQMADEVAPVAEVDREQPAAIFFTGGTTGAPKGAVLPHRALMRGAFNGCFAPGSVLGGDRYICMLPLSHVFGLVRSTLSVFYTGGEWFACEDTKATIGQLPVIKPTMLVLVPGLCEVLLGLQKMYGPQFLGGRLRMIISGAANVPPRMMTEFDALGIQLLAGYGMTEGANLTAGNKDVKTKPTSVGKLYDGQEARIVDGELWLKGDNVFLGYYNDPENTRATLTDDGWLKTGDLAEFDDEGYLYITGRLKNVIILSNGENVSPEAIEEYFYQYPTVRDCLVKEENNAIAIEILPQMQAFEGKDLTAIESYFEKVLQEVNAKLPTTHRVAKMRVRQEDFKRTGSFKVSRNQ